MSLSPPAGRPVNIRKPRSHWEATRWDASPLPWWWFGTIRRQRFADVCEHFSPGAYIIKWWAWGIIWRVGRRGFGLFWMHEQWGGE